MCNDETDASNSALAVSDSPRPTLSHAELRRLVRYWVGMMKEAGLPPEEVLVAVKTLVRDTIVPRYGRYADGDDNTDTRVAFVRDAAQWCIEAYFERVSADGKNAADEVSHTSSVEHPVDDPARQIEL